MAFVVVVLLLKLLSVVSQASLLMQAHQQPGQDLRVSLESSVAWGWVKGRLWLVVSLSLSVIVPPKGEFELKLRENEERLPDVLLS